MEKFYSQNGEDFILNYIFNQTRNGFFVEIGCIDGRRFSNTLFFEERGWTGICVEAHSDYIDLLRKNRPHSKVFHCAVGKENCDQIVFYANSRGSLSTLDKSKEANFRNKFGEYFTGFEEQIIPQRTLTSIFEEADVKSIDILSIDIEGGEIDALQGLDFGKFYPKVMVVESDSHDHEKAIDKILLKQKYKKLLKLSNNIFYIDATIRERDFRHLHAKVNLTHTGNPLFDENDEIFTKEINIKAIKRVQFKKRLKNVFTK